MRTYRYPTPTNSRTALWDGYRYLRAANADAALRLIPDGIGVESLHLQVNVGRAWHFVDRLPASAGGTRPDADQQPDPAPPATPA